MKINVDRAQRVVIDTQTAAWNPSPLPGVTRLFLERDGGEVARATSLVRFAPGAYFTQHTHELGEELLVLDGTFVDEQGTYPAGFYLRNPPGSAHRPHSPDGCTLFVKLRQFDLEDRAQLALQTQTAHWLPEGPGVEVLQLHEFGGVKTAMRRFAPGSEADSHEHPQGEELFVIEGTLEDDQGSYPAGTWIRNPRGTAHHPRSREGCLVFVKRGHL